MKVFSYPLTKIFFIIISLTQIKSSEINISLDDIQTEKLDNENYIISSSILNITSSGDYVITGKCSECQILVDQGIEVSLTINSIEIESKNICPFWISKKAKLTNFSTRIFNNR